MMQRRRFLGTLGALALGTLAVGVLGPAADAFAQAKPLAIDVYKSPLCGCCEEWVKHLRANGFTVMVHDVEDTGAYRKRFGMPERFGSCHTGHIAGYAIEGHVPAADIRKLLAAGPKAVGLAVPGMPVGSPGMEQGSRKDPFDVLLVKADGAASVFSRHHKPAA
ncbi:conserved exported protein of unknown function [Cupriavidus taiwanensis]|uniref:Uncharacterized protein n=1 Tax=Cupriavidus taiwanensis TaxID=164546 RepID=A0A375GXU9_9BURK|nr:DUF411 domain-containing protein [Cupriavidus taiwanensis]SOY56629.1 conserved hypothetical protein, DUF411; putative exported protein [Cupriavidus taiwanensis]SOY57387.1 conserved hypothetical protein, DUF411; putative exported protein [Cupriavidus taiwanensis]SOY79392.1 conserved hypothetical protein, DUF411; putative exported protein [Cupriavidus taiwanensis]SOZ65300.1 conserved hypothetical protein, DUF411; putative exported protein [Cupriavidus taiwanensis]SOZ76564.1 conserved hypothet